MEKFSTFFYLPVTLHGILTDKHIHAMILVKAVRILLGNKVSEDDIRVAEKLLKKFCKLMEEYYGQLSLNCNNNKYKKQLNKIEE